MRKELEEEYKRNAKIIAISLVGPTKEESKLQEDYIGYKKINEILKNVINNSPFLKSEPLNYDR